MVSVRPGRPDPRRLSQSRFSGLADPSSASEIQSFSISWSELLSEFDEDLELIDKDDSILMGTRLDDATAFCRTLERVAAVADIISTSDESLELL
jgi:hypothetical protein